MTGSDSVPPGGDRVAGVPPTEVTRRLGHGVAVLLRVYANCIDGGDDTMNDKIGDALG
ncbi:hypothetical protein ACQP26_27060 [Micromonospora sp. CA-248089]|uniref:hypothetical protein n=1 Tax=Micromonospora sp. CA-248089 TaxID=3239960 RepID=UPI003D8FF2DF